MIRSTVTQARRSYAFALLRISSVTAILAASLLAQGNLNFTYDDETIGGAPSRVVIRDVVGGPAEDAILADTQSLVVRIFDYAGGVLHTSMTTIAPPRSVAVADFDGDGDNDVAAACGSGLGPPGHVHVWLNNSGFGAPATFIVPVIARITARDMDLDGDVDLVVSKTILYNNGSGAFTNVYTIPSTTPTWNWIPGDFDGDGDVDLVTLYGPFTTRMFRNNGAGTFTLLGAASFPTGAPPGSTFDVADMNGDGIDDLVIVGSSSGTSLNVAYFNLYGTAVMTATTFLGGAGFAFTPAPNYSGIGPVIIGEPATRDFDGDGDLDVALFTKRWPLSGPNQNMPTPVDDGVPMVLWNDGAGGLEPAGGRLFTGMPETPGNGIGVGDLDGDGAMDLMVPCAGSFVRAFFHDPALSLTATAFDVWDTILWDYVLLTPTTDELALPQAGILTAVRVRLPNGTPCFGQSVRFQSNVGAQPNPRIYGVTNEDGLCNVLCSTDQTGFPFLASFSLPTGHGRTMFMYSNPLIQAEQDDPQTVPINSPIGALSARLFNRNGSWWTGNEFSTVWWQSSSPNLTLANSVTTANGPLHSVAVNPVSVPGTYVVTAFALDPSDPYLPSPLPSRFFTTFTICVSNSGVISRLSGDGQAVDIGAPFANPLRIRVTNALGQNLAGVPVTFAFEGGPGVVATPSAITDASGIASTIVTASALGPARVRASATGYGVVEFDLFARGLEVPTTAHGTAFIYEHERGNVPVALLVDTPSNPLTFVPTLFGDLYVSVLNPQSTYIALDGIGYFSPPDPTLIVGADRTWRRIYPIVLPPGTSLIAQIVSYDATQPYPSTINLSNPVVF